MKLCYTKICAVLGICFTLQFRLTFNNLPSIVAKSGLGNIKHHVCQIRPSLLSICFFINLGTSQVI